MVNIGPGCLLWKVSVQKYEIHHGFLLLLEALAEMPHHSISCELEKVQSSACWAFGFCVV